jgi:hypothetical protein
LPQWWVFKNDLVDDELVIFDLDYAKSDTGQEGELEVRWSDSRYRPNQDTLLRFREELKRLDDISSNLATDASKKVLSLTSEDEYKVASRYHEALDAAVRSAIFATEQELASHGPKWDSWSEEDACDDGFCD